MKNNAPFLTIGLTLIAACGNDDDSGAPEVSRCLNLIEHQPSGSHPAPAFILDIAPLEITGGNVTNGAKDIDAELVSTHGIQITFTENIKAGTVVLRPEDGAPLNWIVEWERAWVTLYPPDGDRLQNGTDYILEICVKEDTGAEYYFDIRFATKE